MDFFFFCFFWLFLFFFIFFSFFFLCCTQEMSTTRVKYPHVKQSHSWDCGLACVEMILSCFGIENGNLEELKQRCRTKEVWTIDLMFLLYSYKIPCRFTTQTLGVDPNHSTHAFYQKGGRMNEETIRVGRMFEKAREFHFPVQKRDVAFSEILNHLEKGLPFLALVNSSWLICPKCLREKKRTREDVLKRTHFQGHFVLWTAYHQEEEVITYMNPSASHAPCFSYLPDLERAWRSSGTDEDLLWVDQRPQLKTNSS